MRPTPTTTTSDVAPGEKPPLAATVVGAYSPHTHLREYYCFARTLAVLWREVKLSGYVVTPFLLILFNKRRLYNSEYLFCVVFLVLFIGLDVKHLFTGKLNVARELPGAALVCFSFTPKDVNEHQTSKRLREVHTGYEIALVEVAASLQLSRNILLALMAVQSWKGFVRRWMKAYTLSYDAKSQLSVLDKTSKAASDILKSMMAMADEAIPRAAENIALAIGALFLWREVKLSGYVVTPFLLILFNKRRLYNSEYLFCVVFLVLFIELDLKQTELSTLSAGGPIQPKAMELHGSIDKEPNGINIVGREPNGIKIVGIEPNGRRGLLDPNVRRPESNVRGLTEPNGRGRREANGRGLPDPHGRGLTNQNGRGREELNGLIATVKCRTVLHSKRSPSHWPNGLTIRFKGRTVFQSKHPLSTWSNGLTI
ncbi:hypothetical protein LR48_Vigan10g208000 [Vigna angularis]|uniref:Uncharacterized protein n=1 Tax=Phaseolus angularis TaxID=3914 RepID=A0A0L9VMK1_PHAAN|nr:hypothetical protein LR48_Vigan10g208000 [Vigna angularis]